MTGGGSGLTLLLGAVMAAQYAASLAAALLHKGPRTPGAAAVEGLLKKALSLLVVGLCRLLDAFVNEGNAMFYAAAAWFYIGGEALSLLESLAQTRTLIAQAYSGFNTAHDADLIESYVFEINALQSRYSYLLRRVKELDGERTVKIS